MKLMRKTFIFILFMLFVAFPGESAKAGDGSKKTITVTGKATYYAGKFHGRRTANGEIFSNEKFTAAHLKLPFGTIVTVINLDNGRSVDVKVNDRGPHSKVFIIDLSQAAAKEIGMFKKGVGNVELRYTLPGEDDVP
jgi:rare lipoprotein A